MKVFKLSLFLVIGLLFAGAAKAQSIPVIDLDRDYPSNDVVPYVLYVSDYQGEISYADIMERRQAFRRLENGNMRFQTEGAPLLIVFGVRNPSEHSRHWHLRTNKRVANSFRVSLVNPSDTRLIFDDREEVHQGEAGQRNLAYGTSFSLAPHEIAYVAIEADFENGVNNQIDLLSSRTFFDEYHTRIFTLSFITAAFLTTIIVNLVLFGATGRAAFIWLSLAEIFLFYYLAEITGLVFSLDLNHFPLLQYVSMQASFWLGSICFLQFWRLVLNSRADHPILDRVIDAGMVLFAALAVLWFAGYFTDSETRFTLAVFQWVGIVPVGVSGPIFASLALRKLGRVYLPMFVGVSAYALVSVILFVDAEILRGFTLHTPTLVAAAAAFECFMVTVSLGWSILHTSEERVRLLEERVTLNEENALASATIRDQGAMLQASGHDTRQVLLAINSAADHMERTSDPSDRRLVNTLKESAHFLQDILSTTLSAPRTHTADRRCVALSSFSVHELFRSLERIYASAFRQSGIQLSIEVDPEITLVSDRALLMRALSNFVANSLKATAAGQVICRTEKDGERLHISISDTGTGIAPALIDFLLNDAPAPAGLDRSPSGVKIAHAIVQDLGGALGLESQEGEGTTVTITLPHVIENTSTLSVSDWQTATGLKLEDLDRDADQVDTDGEGLLGVTFDDSSQMRARAAESRSLILYKPLVAGMADHPLVKASTQAQ